MSARRCAAISCWRVPRSRPPPATARRPCCTSRAARPRRCSCCKPTDEASPPARGSMPRSRRRSCCPTAARPTSRWRASMMRWRVFPDHPDLLYQKAILLEKAGRTDGRDRAAREPVSRSAAGRRDRERARASCSPITIASLSRADKLITAALKSEPDNPAILDSMGWLDFRRGNAREALPLLERAFRLAQDGDIGAHWGEVLWAAGRQGQGARGLESRADRRSGQRAGARPRSSARACRSCRHRVPAPRSEHRGRGCRCAGARALGRCCCAPAAPRCRRAEPPPRRALGRSACRRCRRIAALRTRGPAGGQQWQARASAPGCAGSSSDDAATHRSDRAAGLRRGAHRAVAPTL